VTKGVCVSGVGGVAVTGCCRCEHPVGSKPRAGPGIPGGWAGRWGDGFIVREATGVRRGGEGGGTRLVGVGEMEVFGIQRGFKYRKCCCRQKDVAVVGCRAIRARGAAASSSGWGMRVVAGVGQGHGGAALVQTRVAGGRPLARGF